VNDLKVPGFDDVDDVFASSGDGSSGDGDTGGSTDRGARWLGGSAALGLLAFGVTAGMIAVVMLVGMSAGAFGAVAGCGGG
jgi:hypothetical protein